MVDSIPLMDQKILNKYFPGQAVKSIMHTPIKSVRGYSFEGNKGLLIATARLKKALAMTVSLLVLQTKWNTSINKEGDHLVCLLYP